MTLYKTVTVVVPVFNEAEVLPLFWERLRRSLDNVKGVSFEVVFVDDGSSDGSFKKICDIAKTSAGVRGIQLSRNFGKEAAMTAGLDALSTDAAILIDVDLQDPPELIPQLIETAQKGFDVVVPCRILRKGESRLKIAFSDSFYWLMSRIDSSARFIPGTGDFRFMSRRVVQAVISLRETSRFMKGIFAWVGYPTAVVPYERESRERGSSKFNLPKLFNHAVDGITSFSVTPLKLATYAGLMTSLFAFVYGIYILTKAFLYGDQVPGFPTLMSVILFTAGIQLLCLGIIGEYLGRVFSQTKSRPLYLVQSDTQHPQP